MDNNYDEDMDDVLMAWDIITDDDNDGLYKGLVDDDK